MHSKLSHFVSPFLGAVIATAASAKGIAISLTLAFIGGGIGWLGKIAIRSLFEYIKAKFTK